MLSVEAMEASLDLDNVFMIGGHVFMLIVGDLLDQF